MLASNCLLLAGLFYSLQLSAGSFPQPLTESEEQYYLAQMKQGKLNARNILIEHNLRLVAHIMKKYYAQADDMDDLISIGTIGLIKGISSYDSQKGVRLATYAARCIENEILMYFRAQKKSAQNVSLSDCIETGADGASLSLMDVVCDDYNLFDQISIQEMKSQLCRAIDHCLTPQEKEVVCLRYGLGGKDPMRQREVADLTGISRSYVSRIEKKALNKLKSQLDSAVSP